MVHVVGHLCPDCQSDEEDLEGQVNAAIQPLSTWRQPEPPPGSDGVMMLAHTPARSYPTPEIMRRKADQLAAARKDVLAAEGKDVSQVVELMRAVAHDMESGAWE